MSRLGRATKLLGIVLLALLAGVARRTRGPHRTLYAAVLATALAWMLHASLDWDWEIAAVTLWLFALAGQAGAGAPAGNPAAEPERHDSRGPRPLARGVMVLGCLALAATPAVVAASQARLSESIRAYDGGDCALASEKARASLDILGSRPQLYEVIGYCDARGGYTRSAERAMREAVERDPRNWEYHYGLALVRASGGRDPRAAARRALGLNPREALARTAVERLDTDDPREWRLGAEEIGLTVRPG